MDTYDDEENGRLSPLIDERDFGDAFVDAPMVNQSIIHDNLVFFIIGSMVRYRVDIKCHDCFETIKGSKLCPELPPELSKLTEFKSEVGLKFCSIELYEMLSHASNLFVEADRKGEIFSLGAFECLLREFILKPVPYIGCSEHSREFITDLVIDFVTKLFKAKAREIKEKHLERSSSKG